jgi:hypothetical protein
LEYVGIENNLSLKKKISSSPQLKKYAIYEIQAPLLIPQASALHGIVHVRMNRISA